MTRFIKQMLKKFVYTEASNQEELDIVDDKKITPEDEYLLREVRVCDLSHIIRKNPEKVSEQEVENALVKHNAIMVNSGNNYYMDIETGKQYRVGKLFSKNEKDKQEIVVININAIYHSCYDEVCAHCLDPNAKFSVKQLTKLRDEHFANRCRQFKEDKVQ